MPEKFSVTIPLTARQKAQIKNATGRTINAVKVEQAGATTVLKSARMKLTRPAITGRYRPGTF